MAAGGGYAPVTAEVGLVAAGFSGTLSTTIHHSVIRQQHPLAAVRGVQY